MIDSNDPQKNHLKKNLIVKNKIKFDNEEGDFNNVYEDFEDKDIHNDALFSYPNPFNDHFTIVNLVVGKTYTIEILNIIGYTVFKDSYSKIGTRSLNIERLQHLNGGVYLLLVKQRGEIILNSKIIKQ